MMKTSSRIEVINGCEGIWRFSKAQVVEPGSFLNQNISRFRLSINWIQDTGCEVEAATRLHEFGPEMF